MFLSSSCSSFAVSVENKVLICTDSDHFNRFIIIENNQDAADLVQELSKDSVPELAYPAAHNVGLASRLDLVDGKWFSAICLSEDGQFLAAADNCKVLRVYRLHSVSQATAQKADLMHSWHLAKRTMAMAFTPNNCGVVVADKLGDAYYYPFDRELSKHPLPILGHISVLTDVAVTKDNQFILTADRDEKIRVSHFPLADDIQAFCLGHSEFVSKILVPWPNRPVVLSGSGDGSVRAFNYLTGEELGSIFPLEKSDVSESSYTYVSSMECIQECSVLLVSFYGLSRIFGLQLDLTSECSSVTFQKTSEISINCGSRPLTVRRMSLVGSTLIVLCDDGENPLRVYPDIRAVIASAGSPAAIENFPVAEKLKVLIQDSSDKKRLDSLFYDVFGEFFNEDHAESVVDCAASKKLRTEDMQ